VFPPKSFFLGGNPSFFEAQKNTKKTDRRGTKRGPFFDTMRITPPHHRNFTIDLQRRWSINRKIGDRQGMSNCFRHALTIANLFFFVGPALGRNNMVNCRVFFRRTTFVVPIRVV
jgi:hypothetical protein